ncbi:MAG: S8 family serine peptidase [Thermotogae bacterium]|nr:S8 family serine peptidase [Thermotogota bacterium]
MLPFWVNLQSKYVPYAEDYSLYLRTKSTWLRYYSFYWFREGEEPERFALHPARIPVRSIKVEHKGEAEPVGRSNPLSYSYGESAMQIRAVGADTLHSMGITGNGVKIGVFDTGFDLTHPALFGVKVGGQMDFNSGDRLMLEDMLVPPPVSIPFYIHSYDCERIPGAYVCVYAGADERALQGINTRAWNLYLYVLNDDSSWSLRNVQMGYEYNPSVVPWQDSLFVAWTSSFGTIKLAVLDTLRDTVANVRLLTGAQRAVLDTLRDTLIVGVFTGDSVKLCYYDRTIGLSCWNGAYAGVLSGMWLHLDTLLYSDGDTIFRLSRDGVEALAAGFYPIYASGRLAYIRHDSVFVDGRFVAHSPLVSRIAFNGRWVAIPMEDNITVFDTTGDTLNRYGWTSCDMPLFLGDRLVFRARGDTVAEAPMYGTGYYHGTRVLSVLAGYVEGRLIGVAPGATYYLAKTEKVGRTDSAVAWENRVEEDFLVSALEWAARRGVQIANISLGYGEDLGYFNYMMDGKTAISSRAVSKALERGVLVVAAMGNVGNRPIPDPNVGDTTLTAPADAHGIVAVSGAVWDSAAQMWVPANQSAFGPSADGRVKPEVIAPFTVVAIDDSFPLVSVSGTSYSAPLVAGALALAYELHPSWDVATFRSKLLETANQLFGYPTPNFITGYGMPDAYALATSEPFEVQPEGITFRVVRTYPNPYSKGKHRALTVVVESPYPADYVSLRIYSASGSLMREERLSVNLSVGITEIPVSIGDLPEGLYFVSVLTERGYATGKFVVVR